jgi:hypothetical protein
LATPRRDVGYRPDRAKQVPLNAYEEPLGDAEVQRVLGVFYSLLKAGPRTPSLKALLRDLTEEQLKQVVVASEALRHTAQTMSENKFNTRKRRDAVREARRRNERETGALAS